MKSNYRKALHKAQTSIVPTKPKKYQSVGEAMAVPTKPGMFENPGSSAIGNVDMNNNGIPDYLEKSSVIPMESHDINRGVFPSTPKVNDSMQMAQIGKENYMSALKTFKKGGSK